MTIFKTLGRASTTSSLESILLIAKISLNEIFAFFKSGSLKKLEKVPSVFALGGIRKKKIKRLAEVGFDGVALLGSVWGNRDPYSALNDYLKLDIELMLRNREG